MTQSTHPRGLTSPRGLHVQPLRRALLTPRGKTPWPRGSGEGPNRMGFTGNSQTEDSTPASGKGAPEQDGPGRLTIGSSHLPPASHAVQPNGGALGEGEGPETGRNRLVGQHPVGWHGRPGCWLQKESRTL